MQVVSSIYCFFLSGSVIGERCRDLPLQLRIEVGKGANCAMQDVGEQSLVSGSFALTDVGTSEAFFLFYDLVH